jgi:hypothetical protein
MLENVVEASTAQLWRGRLFIDTGPLPILAFIVSNGEEVLKTRM